MLSDAWRGNNHSFTYYMMGSGLAIKFLGGRSELMAEFPEHISSEVKKPSSTGIKIRIERKTKSWYCKKLWLVFERSVWFWSLHFKKNMM